MMNFDFMLNIPIAHRGLHDKEKPENSLAAFRAAVEAGYPIETDVYLSKDKEVVVLHDNNLQRMANDPRQVWDCTADELSSLRLSGTDEHVPRFSEALEVIGGKVPILLELKNLTNANAKEFAKRVSDALKDYRGLYAVQSFNPFYVKAYKKLHPEIYCGMLASATSSKVDFGGSPFWKLKARLVRNMSFNGYVKPDFISYLFSDYPQKATERYKGPKLAWTIHSPEDEAQARKYAQNIIFEDYIPAPPQGQN